MVLFPAMFDPANTSTPQFGTAEYVGTPSADVCQFCKQPISQQYYRVRGQMACGTCAEIARQQTRVDSHSAYGRALLFGSGAAILGMAGYATLMIILKGAAVPFGLWTVYEKYGRLFIPNPLWMAWYGVASPFYDLAEPFWGAIGLVILFVGIRIAWRMTAGRPDQEVTGPFNSPAKLA